MEPLGKRPDGLPVCILKEEAGMSDPWDDLRLALRVLGAVNKSKDPSEHDTAVLRARYPHLEGYPIDELARLAVSDEVDRLRRKESDMPR